MVSAQPLCTEDANNGAAPLVAGQSHSGGEARIRGAIAKMMSLHDGDSGLVDVIACGPKAIGLLRSLLLKREPSGIYQPRCLAARALSALGAYDTLRQFLALRHEITDPIERTGEDAVINAAAHELAGIHNESDFDLVLELLRWRLLPGVIECAGEFKRPEAASFFIDGLAEDDCRFAAEAALLKLGQAAIPGLLRCATSASPALELESQTSLRQLRRALGLLAEIGISPEEAAQLCPLTNHTDNKIAVLACKLCFACGPAALRRIAMDRLVRLREESDWATAEDIETYLSEHIDKAG